MKKNMTWELDDRVFHAKCQVAVMHAVYERVKELRKVIKDAKQAEDEIEAMSAFCSDEFLFNYIGETMDDVSVLEQDAVAAQYHIWKVLNDDVCADYKELIGDS
ncbi:MAG: hypothetical protein WCJ49_07550 [Deltaproteobacteria bacterium]